MKYAFCNEMFGDQPFEKAWPAVRKLGYTGIELAPFSLFPAGEAIDVRKLSAARRSEIKKTAVDAGLEVIGLHWLLAKTSGFYLTSPEKAVQEETAEYFKALAQLCADLGGKVMVLGSPPQRNLLPGVGYDEAESYAAEVLRAAMPTCEGLGVTVALEPLGPAEGDFMLTAETAIDLAKLVDSPSCKLHLDVKAMSTEPNSPDVIIRQWGDWLVHFHANDPNMLGPGMGDVEYGPIFEALQDIDYSGWVSLEVFDYKPGPLEIAKQSIDYMEKVWKAVEA